jgi:hypothetical protein
MIDHIIIIIGPDLDDLMAEGVTDSQGRFQLTGHTTEMTDIDPKLNIYHDCKDETIVRKLFIRNLTLKL